jgi:hypothetical protein
MGLTFQSEFVNPSRKQRTTVLLLFKHTKANQGEGFILSCG